MKILLTKKLSQESQALFNGTDAEFVYVADGDDAGFQNALKDSVAILLSTAFKMDAAAIATAPALKVISRTGVGVDNVDVDEARARGIMVLNTPSANALSVAEHALAMIAALSKQLFYYDSNLRKGNFKVRRENRSVDAEGKTLGLVGCGQIGRLVAKKCEGAFNMKTIGYDPFITSDIDNIKILPALADVLRQADYISLHLPLTADTKNLIGSEQLATMKPTAFILNTSRGGIIDESALAKALTDGKIAGAGIDVFSDEPPAADNPLLTAPGTILTPHSAALTVECSKRVAFEAARGIADFCKGNDPQFIFNRKALNK